MYANVSGKIERNASLATAIIIKEVGGQAFLFFQPIYFIEGADWSGFMHFEPTAFPFPEKKGDSPHHGF